jgi:hypothetical protein
MISNRDVLLKLPSDVEITNQTKMVRDYSSIYEGKLPAQTQDNAHVYDCDDF